MLDAAGLGLHAPLEIARYDAAVPAAWRSAALQPDARTAIVVGSGGRALWDAFARAPEVALSGDPLDAYTRRVTEAAARELAPSLALFAFERRAAEYADFVELGRLAGLGVPSRLRLLLHPVYGPWMSLRAVVLTAKEGWQPRGPESRPFDPCRDCPAPCELAGPDFTARRRACVIGPEHTYAEAALAHHAAHSVPRVRLP